MNEERQTDERPKRGEPRRRYVRATRWRRRRFFQLLEQTGQVRLAAELSGLGLGCIYRLKRLEPGFGDRMIAARVEASRRLESAAAVPGDGLVVRRGQGGRLRAVAPARSWWQDSDDAVFLGALRETGNVSEAARLTGFTKKSAYDRRKRRPGFAADWARALAESPPRIEMRLVEEGLRTLDPEAWTEPGERPRIDVGAAIRIVGWLENKARRRSAG